MIATDLKTNYEKYENMAIWQVSDLNEFISSHNQLTEIFEKEYKVKFENRIDNDIADSDFEIITKLLDYFNDKFFLPFSNNDQNHQVLKDLQDKKIINFGMDIYMLNPSKIYILEMDKTQDLKKYDTV